jgi:hypothetical protein
VPVPGQEPVPQPLRVPVPGQEPVPQPLRVPVPGQGPLPQPVRVPVPASLPVTVHVGGATKSDPQCSEPRARFTS